MSVPAERLYALLPAIHRIRDEESGAPLRALLALVESELRVVENDIEALYESWFVETAPEWVVPYLGSLVGKRRIKRRTHASVAEGAIETHTTDRHDDVRDPG